LPKLRFFDILVVLRLDLGQIGFSLVENALATRQLAVLATRMVFQDILAQACAEINRLLNFFSLSFLSFAFLLAAVIGLLPASLGLNIF